MCKMKVLIADDELKICELIKFIINWELLEMEIIAISHNGIDALDKVKRLCPNIIIADIRMPGIDGLKLIEEVKKIDSSIEYIVISGHRDFEYAHKAINLGVKNYLLKPIDQKELFDSLIKIKKLHNNKNTQHTKEEKLKHFEISDRNRIRKQFLINLIERPSIEDYLFDIAKINETYKYSFHNSSYQIIIIKVDGMQKKQKESIKFIKEKIIEILSSMLVNCIEWECYFHKSCCNILLNYDSRNFSDRKTFRKILDLLLTQRDLFKDIQITVGIGSLEDSIFKIKYSLKTAKLAISQRIVSGTNQIIYGDDIHFDAKRLNDFLQEFDKEFYLALEIQDIYRVECVVETLRKNISLQKDITGYEILQLSKQVINSYIFALKQFIPTLILDDFFDKFVFELDKYYTVDEIFNYLSTVIIENFNLVLIEKSELDIKPIREAKDYINNHYNEPISLERLSDKVGFSTAYFSTMFKNEVGINFSEYLLNVRMEKAKELLKETKFSVFDICQKVGYSDIKYFTKRFIQYTSLKPNEYRKLYS